jgi:hypothetical protein
MPGPDDAPKGQKNPSSNATSDQKATRWQRDPNNGLASIMHGWLQPEESEPSLQGNRQKRSSNEKTATSANRQESVIYDKDDYKSELSCYDW